MSDLSDKVLAKIREEKALNIRAATVLRWNRGFNSYMMPRDLSKKLNVPQMVWTDDLKFTTSYDWTMLGVKECNEKDLFVHIGYTYIEITDNCGDKLYYRDALDEFPSPEQITEAWLEVLEAHHEQK